jgi:hypothetical protein
MQPVGQAGVLSIMSTLPTTGPVSGTAPRTSARFPASYRLGKYLALGVTLACVFAVAGFILRKNADPGTRIWILNHTPDQVVIINPFVAKKEKEFLVADGLRELAFSTDFSKAYVASVVDVSNRVTVIDTRTYLQEEEIVVDGVPQGIGVFPDNRKIAVILGSKSDFMAGGFDVLDLGEQSKADPKKKKRLYRERGLLLTHKIAVGDDGDKIYCIDAKSSLVAIYSLKHKQRIGEVDLHGAPEQMYYPRQGDSYYVSVLVHQAIYQINKQTDQVQGAYIYQVPDPSKPFNMGRLRFMALDSKARYLYATNYEQHSVAIWEVGNPIYSRSWENIPPTDKKGFRFPVTHYLPVKEFLLKGGMDPNVRFVPGGQQIAIDPYDEYLYVMDDMGGFYIFDIPVIQRCKDKEIIEPRGTFWFGGDIEVRDLKVSRPAALKLGGGPSK